MEEMSTLLELSKRKYQFDKKETKYDSHLYIEEMKKELDEVLVELQNGTRVHLEDELGDVLWDFCNIVVALEKNGSISLHEVFRRSCEKYEQRISGIEQGKRWEDIKKEQKKQLKFEEQNNSSSKKDLL